MDLKAIAETEPLARAEFTCAGGHGRAGEVRLHCAAGSCVVVVDSFLSMTTTIAGHAKDSAREALNAGDAAALYRLDLELAPFYCPRCDAVYCRDCWRTYNVFDEEMPGWFEETRGICPQGHERMLMD